eukprot:TRINITY_DN108170_c0_g1_i1.p1 TRINITY_DN108170_c0_g1~~TRINITY_DN108170_c0_g1_i1.p1  ORF type:complete len:159 (-),score=16.15 TRINITY_DN108170_c0_g1_i1:61-537(-)
MDFWVGSKPMQLQLLLLLVVAFCISPVDAQIMNFTAWWGCGCGPSGGFNTPWGSNVLNFAGNECDSGFTFDLNYQNVYRYQIKQIDFDYFKNQSYLIHSINGVTGKKTQFRMVRNDTSGGMGEGCYTLDHEQYTDFDWTAHHNALATCSFEVKNTYKP